jgi:hypothetical protein
MIQPIERPRVLIRPPQGDEMEKLRKLMPFAAANPEPSRWKIALEEGTGNFKAGWSVYIAEPATATAGFFWRLEENGPGPVMVKLLVKEALAMGMKRLALMRMVPQGGPEAAFWLQHGFSVWHESRWYEGALEVMQPRMEEARQRLDARAKGLGQQDISIRALVSDDMAAVKDLITRHQLARDYEWESRSWGEGGYDQEVSVVAECGGRLAGVLLVSRPAPRLSAVDIRVVDKQLGMRAGAANILMMGESIRRARALGVTHVRFRARPDEHLETERLAERSGAVLLSTQVCLGRDELHREER